MTFRLSKNFHGVGIGPLSKILAVKYAISLKTIPKLNQKYSSFTLRSTFASVSNVLYALNYSKNFYLYCMVHEDIRRVAMEKLRDLHRKLKNCCTPENALAL